MQPRLSASSLGSMSDSIRSRSSDSSFDTDRSSSAAACFISSSSAASSISAFNPSISCHDSAHVISVSSTNNQIFIVQIAPRNQHVMAYVRNFDLESPATFICPVPPRHVVMTHEITRRCRLTHKVKFRMKYTLRLVFKEAIQVMKSSSLLSSLLRRTISSGGAAGCLHTTQTLVSSQSHSVTKR